MQTVSTCFGEKYENYSKLASQIEIFTHFLRVSKIIHFIILQDLVVKILK